MQKNAKYLQKKFFTKWLLIFALLFINFSFIYGSIYSQDTKFNFELNSVTIGEVFEQIENQSEFIFFYQSEVIDLNKKVSVNAKDNQIENILDKIFKGEDVSYEIIDRQVIIKKKNEPVESKKTNPVKEQNPSVSQQPQSVKVTGTVTSQEEGEPLPGVTILQKGNKNNGTITDPDGRYTIEVPQNDSLIFSFVGYQETTVAINGRSQINVAMVSKIEEIEEVVVVGYGRQSRITTTGSISSVNADEIEKASAPTIGEALAGKAPGLSTIQTTGQPGESDPEIFLRGVGTMNNTNPLIIIDGVPNEIREFMQLNPANIANISILKDASATAVYGVRGANGVIIVDTKRGKTGETKIQANASYGYQQPTQMLEFANSYQWAKAYNQALINDNRESELIPQFHIEHYRKQDEPLLYPDHDWVEEAIDNAAMQTQSNLNISGGTERVKYFTSVGYFRQDGLLKQYGDNMQNYGYNRFNIGSNVDIKVTPTTDIALNTRARIGNRKLPHGDHPDRRWQRLYDATPMATAGYIDGKFISFPATHLNYAREVNFLEDLYGGAYDKRTENRLNLNLDIRQKLEAISPVLKGLQFRAKGGYRSGFNENIQARIGDYERYEAMYNTLSANPNPALPDSAVILNKISDRNITNWYYGYNANRYIYWETGFDYQRSFGQHNVGGLVLYNQNKDYYPNLAYGNIATGNVGFVGRMSYNYNKQYMLEVNLGYNGSENFAKDQRFGFFPSISGGWVISKEKFMQSIEFIDRLKIRASYGIVGSDQAGRRARFIYLGDVYNRDVDKYYGYNFGNQIPDFKPGVNEASIGNEEVTWETAEKQNFGIDISIFDQLTFNLDYFHEYRSDILMYRNSDPEWLAMDLPAVNIGEVENQGFEIQTTWEKSIGDFYFRVNGNISRAINEVIFMDEIPPLEPYQSFTGHPLGSQFGYVWEGFYSEEEAQVIENERAAEDINPEDYTYPIPEIVSEIGPGDMKYKDLNNDNIINDADQKVYGYPERPQIIGGINLDFAFKGFDLSVGLQGASEVSRNLRNPVLQNFGGTDDRSLFLPNYEGYWTPERAENGTAEWPRLTFQNATYNVLHSTWRNRDASYIRMKRIELGYSFDNYDLSFAGIKSLRIYLRGNNLFTLKKEEMKWIDPERNPSQMEYPLVKFYAAGLNLSF